MRRLDGLDWTAVILTVIGALNWGLIGLFDFNLVSAIFGERTLWSRIIYTLVGISGLYLIYTASKMGSSDVDVERR
jgi:uncharacterized protein